VGVQADSLSADTTPAEEDSMTDDPTFERGPSDAPAPTSFAAPEPPRRRRATTIVSSVIVILAIVAGAAFAVRNVRTSATGGTSTPQGAVQRFLDAAARQDALGVLASLVPGERDALRAPLQDLVAELSRLGILSNTVDLSKVSGIQTTFSGLQLSSTSLDADHAVVESTAGSVTTRIDPKAVPLGSFVRNLAGSALDAAPTSKTQSLTGADAIRLVAVRQGGHWYTSIAYSIAEATRHDSGGPPPTFGSGIQPAGAPTAEAATRRLLQALVGFDFQSVIAVLAPDESAAFRDYSASYAENMTSAGAEIGSHFSIDLTSIDLTSEVRAGETLVKIKRITFTAAEKDRNTRVEFDGTCLKSSGLPLPPSLCGNEVARLGGLPATAAKPDLGFVCVQQGGLWYVSPTRTVLEGITAVLRTLKPSDLTTLTQLLSRFARRGLSPNPFGLTIRPSIAPLLPQS
jgi:hypothetical protein